MSARRARTAALALAALLFAAGCGGREEDLRAGAGAEPTRVLVALDDAPNATHAGVLLAADEEEGPAGLDLVVQSAAPGRPACEEDALRPSLQRLVDGDVDFALASAPDVLLARDRGIPVLAVATIVQGQLASLTTLAGAGAPADPLRADPVLTAAPGYVCDYVGALLDGAGEDPAARQPVATRAAARDALLRQRGAAAVLADTVEVAQLEASGRSPRATLLTETRLRAPRYDELVLVVRQDDARERGELIRRVLTVLERSHERLLDGGAPARADAERVLGAARGPGPRDRRAGATPDRAALAATIPRFRPRDERRPFGWIEDGEWVAHADWMRRAGLFRRDTRATRAVTTEFLPGEGF